MQAPCISVIVPVYKVEPYLAACVDSILTQSFTNFELILVDDGSPDHCGILCDEYAKKDERVRVIHQKNGGLSAARNAGLAIAKGDAIAFVDSDDVVSVTYLEQLYDALCSSNADLAVCAVEDVAEDGKTLVPPQKTLPSKVGIFSGKELFAEFFGKNSTYYTVAWNKLYRRKLWQSLRYPEGMIHEDDAVAHLLYWNCDTVVCLEEPLYRYRLRQGSICRTGVRPGSFDGVIAHAQWCRFFRGHHTLHPLVSPAIAGCVRRYLALCAQAKQHNSWALIARWYAAQSQMRFLLPLIWQCALLSVKEKISCHLWCRKILPTPPKTDKRRVALLMPPDLPVPAVKGGAVEGLATQLLQQQQLHQTLELVVITIPDEHAALQYTDYASSVFCAVPVAHGMQTLLHRIHYRLGGLIGRPIHWHSYYRQAIPFLKALAPDFLVAEGGDFTGWQQACRMFGADRMVAHLHGLTHSTPKLDQCYHHALVLSQAIRKEWLDSSTMPSKHALLLHNGICTQRFSAPVCPETLEQIRSEAGFAADDFVVLFCGRLEEDKGIHKLVQAMLTIDDPTIKLLVVGSAFFGNTQSSPFTQHLQTMAKPLGQRIHFTGYVPGDLLPAYYQLANVTVMPTLVEEAAGLVAVEAMAAGCPVIATQSGGLPEYVQGSDTILLPRNDQLCSQLAQSIVLIKEHPEQAAVMSQSGKECAKRFTTARYYSDFCKAIEQMEESR